MRLSKKVRAVALGVLLSGAVAGVAAATSSSQTPYILPSQPSVATTSIITVGDAAANGYRMVGIPDGLGAFDNGHGTFTLLMNHELGATAGTVRAHGSKGAFVSKWIIRKKDLTVVSGEDLMKTVYQWQNGAYVAATTAFSRFCSADLAAPSAFYNKRTHKGYDGRIFLNGEESGTEGRAMAHLLDGNSYQLPYLGRMAWENALANPGTGDKTVVGGTDDGPGGQVYFYFGDKRSAGNPIEKAGLSGGQVYGVKVPALAGVETDASTIAPGTPFTLAPIGDVSGKTGVQFNADSVAAGATTFQRPRTARGIRRIRASSTSPRRRATPGRAGCGGSRSTTRPTRPPAARSTCCSTARRDRR